MGGNVFATPARRLTTDQLLSLLAHTKSTLQPFFEGMEVTRFFGEKKTHGDLDVLCGLWTIGQGWKGSNQEGVLDPAKPLKDEAEAKKCMEFGKEQEREWSTAEVKLFCEVLEEKVGAVKWEKHGYEVSYAVPCRVIDRKTTMTGVEDFYQIDMLLVQPNRLQFSVMTQSYGVTALLYAAAVRRMSSSLTCHNDRFVIRYSPYQGLKALEVELTSDPLQFMEWAGLDPIRFEQGFQTEKQYWLWLTCLTDEDQGADDKEREEKYEALMQKRFPQGWRVMAMKKSGEKDSTKMPKGHTKVRLEVMVRFREWLKTTIYVPKPTTLVAGSEEAGPAAIEQDGQAKDEAEAPSPSIDTSPTIVKLASLILGPSPPPPTTTNTDTLSATPGPKEQNLVNPDKPKELSHNAQSALEYFGKVPEWSNLFEGKKQEAKILADRQARNNKERAAVFDLASKTGAPEGQGPSSQIQFTPIDTVSGGAMAVPTPVVRKEGEGKVVQPEDLDEGVSL